MSIPGGMELMSCAAGAALDAAAEGLAMALAAPLATSSRACTAEVDVPCWYSDSGLFDAVRTWPQAARATTAGRSAPPMRCPRVFIPKNLLMPYRHPVSSGSRQYGVNSAEKPWGCAGPPSRGSFPEHRLVQLSGRRPSSDRQTRGA